jgi:hypothetical protein
MEVYLLGNPVPVTVVPTDVRVVPVVGTVSGTDVGTEVRLGCAVVPVAPGVVRSPRYGVVPVYAIGFGVKVTLACDVAPVTPVLHAIVDPVTAFVVPRITISITFGRRTLSVGELHN